MKRTNSTIHYAWVICAAGTLLFFVLTGLSNNAYAVYQPFICSSFSLSQTALSFMNTCRNLAAILSTIVLAAFYKKFSLKRGMTIAAMFTIVGFAVMGMAISYPALVIGCAMAVLPLVATSFGYSSSVMATTVSIGGLSLLCGKLLYGWLCEKITQFKTVLLFGSLMILGLSLLTFGSRSTAFLYTGSVLWVGSLAMIAIGLVAWPADWFKESEQISCRQRFIFLHTGGTFAFSIVPGILADHFGGSYLPTVLIFLAEAIITLTVVVITYRASGRTHG